jgi:dTDP-4-amino-4,6-dideoxygalactose transaminase
MIKFLDLKKLNERFQDEFKSGFDAFLQEGQTVLGSQVASFEKEFATYCGVSYCIGVSNGLDALSLIFEAYKHLKLLKNGDEIIVPANTYIASVLAISNSGLIPVFVEPDSKTYNIDSKKIEASITSKTKAILGVHLYGQLYDVKGIELVAKHNNLLLIEDAAQAHGATYNDGRKSGNVSNSAAFSFYPTKNLGALGDAGAVTTNDIKLAEVIFKLRNYGRTTSYKNDVKGYNCRLDELQAVFLRIKLKILDADNQKRRNIAKKYLKNIKNENIKFPYCADLNQHVFHLFVIRCKKRVVLQKFLLDNEIESFIYYPVPIHHQKAYKEFNELKLPITEQIHNEVLSIPLNPILNRLEIDKIINVLNAFE